MLDWRHKGFPQAALGVPPAGLAALSLDALRDDTMFPLAVLKESALRHNGDWMRRFADAAGVRLCPHGKTTMAPVLFERQLADGAWGITAATAHHVRVYRQFGIGRILLANQLVGPGNIGFVLDELARDPAFEFYALVDSVAGVDLLAAAARARRIGRPLDLLVEIGASGGRTGVRDHATGLAVARAVAAAAPWLALRGVEAFEGIFQTGDASPAPVAAMLDRLTALAVAAEGDGLFAPGPVLLTAGGSGFFDLCAERLRAAGLRREVEVVIRSGCYIAHDSGLYAKLLDRLGARSAAAAALGEGLRPALEVWSVVQSVPEPGRMIAALGKRDIGSDAGMPQPLWWLRPGDHSGPQPFPPGHAVVALYDQHAVVDGPGAFAVGDLVGFGVSHPCTTFDKWRMLAVVDDGYRIVDAIETFF